MEVNVCWRVFNSLLRVYDDGSITRWIVLAMRFHWCTKLLVTLAP